MPKYAKKKLQNHAYEWHTLANMEPDRQYNIDMTRKLGVKLVNESQHFCSQS